MCLPTYMVDVELTIRMVKGIHTYYKDHTAESTIFSPWSKSVIPFPSLRSKIQAFKDDNNSKQATTTWGSSMMPQFFTPHNLPKAPENMPQAKSGPGGLDATISLI